MAKGPYWLIKQGELQRLREKAGHTLDTFSEKTGISKRQLGNLESNDPAKRRTRPSTVRVLAKALGVKPEEFAEPLVKRASVAASPSPSAEPPASRRNFSELEQLAEIDRHNLGQHRASVRGHSLALLTGDVLGNIFSMPMGYDGEEYAFEGNVSRKRGSTPAEALALGGTVNHTPRIELSRPVEGFPTPLAVTAFVTNTALAKPLVESVARSQAWRCRLRVAFLQRADGHFHVEGLSKPTPLTVQPQEFLGFSGWATRMPHAWTFALVDAEPIDAPMLVAPRTNGAKKTRATKTDVTKGSKKP